MVERVARAICDSVEADNFDELPRDSIHRAVYVQQARAAIEAMRAADNDMLEAMHNAMFAEPFDGTNLPMLGAGFEAAIDAALNPQTPA